MPVTVLRPALGARWEDTSQWCTGEGVATPSPTPSILTIRLGMVWFTMSEVRAIWNVRVLAKQRAVFSQNVGDSFYAAVFWLHEHFPEIEAVVEQHIDDQPQVVIEDVFVSEDN